MARSAEEADFASKLIMKQLNHLRKNQNNLNLKFAVLRLIREWFWSQEFVEVESPIIVNLPGQEPNLSPMPIVIHDEKNIARRGYLHTSPEYTMKKMLAAGWNKIFYLGKCFRDQESFGGWHNPEFTMLEWYRAQADYAVLMSDIEGLINYIIKNLIENFKFKKVTMKELWDENVEVNLDDYLDKEKMFELCVKQGFKPETEESYEELFYRIFLNKIEPELKDMGAVIIYEYPAKMASLSRLSKNNPKYAERFEIYINGLEIANAFSELTDAGEQLKRLQAEQKERARLGKEVYDIDEEFIEAVEQMPESAGIALGVDRLVMILADCKNIDDVITLPASKLFNQ